MTRALISREETQKRGHSKTVAENHSMKPVLHSSPSQTRIKKKKELETNLFNELRCKSP
jgi:hypothetical protein